VSVLERSELVEILAQSRRAGSGLALNAVHLAVGQRLGSAPFA